MTTSTNNSSVNSLKQMSTKIGVHNRLKRTPEGPPLRKACPRTGGGSLLRVHRGTQLKPPERRQELPSNTLFDDDGSRSEQASIHPTDRDIRKNAEVEVEDRAAQRGSPKLFS
uniref:Uncharacterized protein n=1 Tax=Panagrellus redivivus TaxID=6233 RepID=A0A7E4VPH7_PANRE